MVVLAKCYPIIPPAPAGGSGGKGPSSNGFGSAPRKRGTTPLVPFASGPGQKTAKGQEPNTELNAKFGNRDKGKSGTPGSTNFGTFGNTPVSKKSSTSKKGDGTGGHAPGSFAETFKAFIPTKSPKRPGVPDPPKSESFAEYTRRLIKEKEKAQREADLADPGSFLNYTRRLAAESAANCAAQGLTTKVPDHILSARELFEKQEAGEEVVEGFVDTEFTGPPAAEWAVAAKALLAKVV